MDNDECKEILEKAIADIGKRLDESQAREEGMIELVQSMLDQFAVAATERNKVVVKSSRAVQGAARLALGVLLLMAIAGLFWVYGDPEQLQYELQRWYPLVVPMLLWGAAECFGIDVNKMIDGIGSFLGVKRSDSE